jgi:hypothetical protein
MARMDPERPLFEVLKVRGERAAIAADPQRTRALRVHLPLPFRAPQARLTPTGDIR